MDVFDLQARLGIDTQAYTNGLSKAKSAMQTFSTHGVNAMLKLKNGISTVANTAVNLGKSLTNNVADVAKYGDTVDKESQKLGISAEAYQEWDAVMQHAGGSVSNLKPALKTLSKEIVNNSNAFKQLGISQEEIINQPIENVLGTVIEKLQGMPAGVERTRLATELLGRSSVELGALLNTSAEDTQKMKDRVHELGGVMSNEAVKAAATYQDELQDMNTAIEGVKRNLTSQLLPAFTSVMSGITKLVGGDVEGGMEQIFESVSNIIDKIIEKIPEVASALKTLIEGIFKKIPTMLPELLKQIINLISDFAKNAKQLLPYIKEAISNLLDGIIDFFENDFDSFVEDIIDLALGIIEMLTDPDVLGKIIEAAIKGVTAFAEGIIEALPKIIEKLPVIITNVIKSLLQNIPVLVEAGIKLFVALVQNLPAIIAGIVKAIPEIIGGILSAFGPLGESLGNLFSGAWEAIQQIFNPEVIGQFFSSVWQGIQNAFSAVGQWFSDVFSAAWEGIKNVFSPVGEMFGNIGKSILNGLSSVINGIIWGINQVIKVPFDGLNWILRAIRDINIAGLKPFDWISEIPVPQIPSIPMLAQGGVLKRGQIALLEGQGDEAVIPLSQNTQWIDMVADRLNNKREESQPNGNNYTFNITIANMNANSQEDIESLAETLMEIMADKTRRKGAVW